MIILVSCSQLVEVWHLKQVFQTIGGCGQRVGAVEELLAGHTLNRVHGTTDQLVFIVQHKLNHVDVLIALPSKLNDLIDSHFLYRACVDGCRQEDAPTLGFEYANLMFAFQGLLAERNR